MRERDDSRSIQSLLTFLAKPYIEVNLECLFLVTCTRLYTSLCRSVGPKSLRFFRRLELNGDQIRVTAPAQLLYCPCPPARD